MAIEVKLQAFEGPLDLLLHLIEKNKVDIYDIPIAEITDQYLEYVRAMEREDMDVTSEFMLMAATLLDIKCRMLLPREKNEEGEEEDPRAELVQQLLEHKEYRFKAMKLDSVLVIADEVDENLYLASRNLGHVLVIEPRYADPVSLLRYKKVLLTRGAIDKLKEMFA